MMLLRIATLALANLGAAELARWLSRAGGAAVPIVAATRAWTITWQARVGNAQPFGGVQQQFEAELIAVQAQLSAGIS